MSFPWSRLLVANPQEQDSPKPAASSRASTRNPYARQDGVDPAQPIQQKHLSWLERDQAMGEEDRQFLEGKKDMPEGLGWFERWKFSRQPENTIVPNEIPPAPRPIREFGDSVILAGLLGLTGGSVVSGAALILKYKDLRQSIDSGTYNAREDKRMHQEAMAKREAKIKAAEGSRIGRMMNVLRQAQVQDNPVQMRLRKEIVSHLNRTLRIGFSFAAITALYQGTVIFGKDKYGIDTPVRETIAGLLTGTFLLGPSLLRNTDGKYVPRSLAHMTTCLVKGAGIGLAVGVLHGVATYVLDKTEADLKTKGYLPTTDTEDEDKPATQAELQKLVSQFDQVAQEMHRLQEEIQAKGGQVPDTTPSSSSSSSDTEGSSDSK